MNAKTAIIIGVLVGVMIVLGIFVHPAVQPAVESTLPTGAEEPSLIEIYGNLLDECLEINDQTEYTNLKNKIEDTKQSFAENAINSDDWVLPSIEETKQVEELNNSLDECMEKFAQDTKNDP